MSQNLDNAVADMKRQLKLESKNDLIRQWVGLYVQATQALGEVEKLKSENLNLKSQIEKLNTTASAVEGAKSE